VIEMLALSMLLALLFEFGRSLWPGILCHGLNNLALMVAYSLNRHSPDDLQNRGNRTTLPPTRERHRFRSHAMA